MTPHAHAQRRSALVWSLYLSKPHKLLPCVCQSCLCTLLLVAVREPPVVGWRVDSVLHHKLSLVGCEVLPLHSVFREAEVGVVLSELIGTLPESDTLQSNIRYWFWLSGM